MRPGNYVVTYKGFRMTVNAANPESARAQVHHIIDHNLHRLLDLDQFGITTVERIKDETPCDE